MGGMEAGGGAAVPADCARPWCLFGFFLGIQKETRRRLRPQARFGAQPPAGRHLARRWRRNTPYITLETPTEPAKSKAESHG